MTISYEWLCNYLPERPDPEKLSKILTSIGLEVEHMEYHDGSEKKLKGLVVGEIKELTKHPQSDHLFITKVDVGPGKMLTIVCGAANTALHQKVVVAKTGVTISPLTKDPFQINIAKIRGEKSEGMLCAEDEIGISPNHEGIIVLPDDAVPGMPVDPYFDNIPSDTIFEIGLTPNRMDAMSHIGVAKDICAWMTYHNKKNWKASLPYQNNFKADSKDSFIEIEVENFNSCPRYSAISITDVTVKDSPDWLQQRLKSIGLSPINNIVDITNFILHESGQPLHAFDQDAILGKKVIIRHAKEGEIFKTLDDKERNLNRADLLICHAEGPMCIAGVFGGIESSVKKDTRNIFLESAFFNPETIRKTSTGHLLRTDAAIHFEKGVDISNTVNVLKRAALLIREIAGGNIGPVTDIYPTPKEKPQIELKYQYLKKLTGKNYHPENVKKILDSLEFDLLKEGADSLWVSPPESKLDILLPADIVEEVLRIDGLDEVEIPGTITFSPSFDDNSSTENLVKKLSSFFVSQGFHEIITNSLTNALYFSDDEIQSAAQPMNSLSNELNILKPQMLPTALEVIAFNLKRKFESIKFFEKGKTYSYTQNEYHETEHFCAYISGMEFRNGWQVKEKQADFYFTKGLVDAVCSLCGLKNTRLGKAQKDSMGLHFTIHCCELTLGKISLLNEKYLKKFEINQPVYCIDFLLDKVLDMISNQSITFHEIPKYPSASRDLAVLTNKNTTFEQVQEAVLKLDIKILQQIHLFDVFQSDKLGNDKKSFAINFLFMDTEKTLTDSIIDENMQRIIQTIETNTPSEIRKS
ncbi:MAG: phenylalanine--tRNA ligase subunit beta [Bacteroidetes bacterium]|nr:phenylalanine--tRNA ligase subunit beta [Bacteroidota bacterium]